MIVINMDIAKSMNKLPYPQPGNLRQHHCKQSVRSNVKRHSQKNIGAALVKLAGQFAVYNHKLKQSMARRRRVMVIFYQLLYFADIPAANNNPS